MNDEPTMIIPVTVHVPGRIRDLWSGRLAGLGHCPTCERLLDEPHLETCRWPGLVGSNAEEHWL